jgi:probable phosphoglycerate mutase
LSAAVQDAEDAGARTLLVVTHGGPIRALLREVVGLDPRSAVPSHPASLTVLDVEGGSDALRVGHGQTVRGDGAVRLRLYNYSPALSRQDPSD